MAVLDHLKYSSLLGVLSRLSSTSLPHPSTKVRARTRHVKIMITGTLAVHLGPQKRPSGAEVVLKDGEGRSDKGTVL